MRTSPAPLTVYPIGIEQRRQVVGGERRPDDAVDLADADRRTTARAAAATRLAASTAPACTTRSGHVSASSSTKRAIDVSICHGSTPRSLRADASERRPSRADAEPDADVGEPGDLEGDRRASASLISVSAPPMIPPMPIGRSSASQISRSSGVSERVDVVERRDLLAVAGAPDAEAVAAQRRQVVGVVGLAELEHHVVADVDDVVDRAHAGRGQALGHPRRRRADRHAVDAPST